MIIFKKEKFAIQKYKDYIEGKTDFDLFWKEYLSHKELMKYLSKAAKRKHIFCIDKKHFLFNPRDYNSPDFRTKYLLQKSICCYLDMKKIKYDLVVKEFYLYEKWDDYIPSFIPYNESNYYYLENLDNGKRHSKKYYRNLYSKIYQYEKYPPNWMHMSEWPIDDDGTPTKFLYQTGFPNRHDFIEYWFIKKNGEKIKVEQYD